MIVEFESRVVALRDGIDGFLSAPPEPSAIRAHAQQFAWDEPIRVLVDLFRDLVA